MELLNNHHHNSAIDTFILTMGSPGPIYPSIDFVWYMGSRKQRTNLEDSRRTGCLVYSSHLEIRLRLSRWGPHHSQKRPQRVARNFPGCGVLVFFLWCGRLVVVEEKHERKLKGWFVEDVLGIFKVVVLSFFFKNCFNENIWKLKLEPQDPSMNNQRINESTIGNGTREAK